MALHWTEEGRPPVVFVRLFSGAPGSGARHASCIETDQEDVPRRRTWVSGIVFNVKSSNTHSVNRMVKLLGGEVVHIPKRPGEPDRTFADTGKTCRILG